MRLRFAARPSRRIVGLPLVAPLLATFGFSACPSALVGTLAVVGPARAHVGRVWHGCGGLIPFQLPPGDHRRIGRVTGKLPPFLSPFQEGPGETRGTGTFSG
jgi:hypothetical protein